MEITVRSNLEAVFAIIISLLLTQLILSVAVTCAFGPISENHLQFL